MNPIDSNCECSTCKTYTRSYLHHIINEPVACSALTAHNVAYQLKLMKEMREHISNDTFPDFVKSFMSKYFEDSEIPKWIKDALKSVNIDV